MNNILISYCLEKRVHELYDSVVPGWNLLYNKHAIEDRLDDLYNTDPPVQQYNTDLPTQQYNTDLPVEQEIAPEDQVRYLYNSIEDLENKLKVLYNTETISKDLDYQQDLEDILSNLYNNDNSNSRNLDLLETFKESDDLNHLSFDDSAVRLNLNTIEELEARLEELYNSPVMDRSFDYTQDLEEKLSKLYNSRSNQYVQDVEAGLYNNQDVDRGLYYVQELDNGLFDNENAGRSLDYVQAINGGLYSSDYVQEVEERLSLLYNNPVFAVHNPVHNEETDSGRKEVQEDYEKNAEKVTKVIILGDENDVKGTEKPLTHVEGVDVVIQGNENDVIGTEKPLTQVEGVDVVIRGNENDVKGTENPQLGAEGVRKVVKGLHDAMHYKRRPYNVNRIKWGYGPRDVNKSKSPTPNID